MTTWLCELGGRSIARAIGVVLGNRTVGGAVVGGLGAATDFKATFDRAMQAVLGFFNLPSKTDYNRLLAKVEVLQGSLVNLNLKVDRLLAHRPGATGGADDR